MIPRLHTSRSCFAFSICSVLLLLVRCSEGPAGAGGSGIRIVQPEETDDGWETATLASVGMNDVPFGDLVEHVGAGSYEEVHSVVVVKDRKLVFEAYCPGHDFSPFAQDYHGDYIVYDRNTRHNTHSTTKSFTSALIGIAIDHGFIRSEHDTVFDYLPARYALQATEGRERITVRDCLMMASGLQWNEWEEPTTGTANDLVIFLRSPDPIGYLLSKPLVSVPGTRFYYNGGTVNLLGLLLEYSGDDNVRTFSWRHLFEPLGITNYNWQVHSTGLTICHGDIYITPRDMAKFGQLFLDNGMWNGTRIVSEEWVQRSTQYHINPGVTWANGYGYLWWLRNLYVNGRLVQAVKSMGWGGQEIFIIRELSMVVVFTGANYVGSVPCDVIMERYVLPAALEE